MLDTREGRYANRYAFVNGELLPEASATVSVFDSSLATGDMVTEVTRTFGHEPFRLREHIERLYAGLGELDIPAQYEALELESISRDLLARNTKSEAPDVEWQIVHYCSRGLESLFSLFDDQDRRPTTVIVCFPLRARQGKMAKKYVTGIELVIPPQRAIPARIVAPQIKSRGRLDYKIAKLQADRISSGASALLCDSDDYITEGTGTNIFLVRDGVVLTPPGTDCLNGVTRGVMLELASSLRMPLEERPISRDELAGMNEAFVTSTIIGMLHVRKLDGRILGDGLIGTQTKALRDEFVRYVGHDFIAEAQTYAQNLSPETVRI